MMQNITMEDEWQESMQILVSPLSLEQYWDCYWSDDAPYYLQAIILDPEDIVLLGTDWRQPSQG